MRTEITEAARRNGIDLGAAQAERLARYAELLADHNSRFNLTAVTEPAEVAVKHFADSLAGAALIPLNAKCADIGTGAGFPAVPIKILRDDLRFVLLDSLNKRIGFLNDVIRELGLTDTAAVHTRAEDYARTGRGMFDAALARAVAPLPALLEYALPLVKTGGVFIAYKGAGAKEELAASANALRILGGTAESVREFLLDGIYARSLIVIRKTAETPLKYPRRGDKPRRNPL